MRDRTRKLLLGATGGAAVLAAYAFLVEPRWLQRTYTRLSLQSLPSSFGELRIAVLADFHVGRGTPLSLVRRACRMAMAARPDLIALTGDFTSAPEEMGNVTDLLDRYLHAPLGVYAVPGNHDYIEDLSVWRRAVAASQHITDLTNAAVTVERAGARLWIAGVDDLTEGMPKLEQVVPGPDDANLTLLLVHNPELAEQACDLLGPVDLVLSGHTHGGQVRLPWIGALRNPVEHDAIYEYGLVRRPWASVYVSRGVGTSHLPVRFLCRPEVAVIVIDGTA